MRYEPNGSVKGQHLAHFAVELSIGDEEEIYWKLHVDGSSNKAGGGAGIVLEGPNDIRVEQSLIFKFKISNNQAEYELFIVGMELARDLGVANLECRTNSQLVEGHMSDNFQVKDDLLLQYFHKAKQLAAHFRTIRIEHVPRGENTRADILSKLSSDKEKGQLNSVIRQMLMKPTIECLSVGVVTERECWREDILRLIREQDEGKNLPADDAKRIARYCIIGEDLYRRGYVTPIMKCLSATEADYVMRELHEGVCGRHTGGRALRARVLRAGFFWPTLEKDCMDFAKKCLACQKHGNVFHAPTTELHNIMSPWSLAQWRMEIVGPFPVARAQRKFLLVAVDYITKWVEAESLVRISASQV